MEMAVTLRLLKGRAHQILIARDRALLFLCADAGLRADELSRLNRSCLDFETGIISILRGKRQKPRRLSLVDATSLRTDGGDTLAALREYSAFLQAAYGDEDGPLFVSYHHRRLSPDQMRKVLHRVCEQAGIEHRTPHAFRRTTFTESYRANPLALPVLRARMGWSPKSHNMVNIYTRGVELEIAAETTIPSVARKLRESPMAPAPSFEPGKRRPPQATLNEEARSHSNRNPLTRVVIGGSGDPESPLFGRYR